MARHRSVRRTFKKRGGGFFDKLTTAVTSVAKAVTPTGTAPSSTDFVNTTNQPFCFNIPRSYPNVDNAKKAALAVGPEGFKKYEYLLYTTAQLARIAYCDTGIGYQIIKKYLGQEPHTVNDMISQMDKTFNKEKRQSQESQVASGLVVSGATTSLARGLYTGVKGVATGALKTAVRTAALPTAAVAAGVGEFNTARKLLLIKNSNAEYNRKQQLLQLGGANTKEAGALEYTLPMESYSLGKAPPADSPHIGFYLSSPEDLTCYGVKASGCPNMLNNKYTVYKPEDIFLTFKGSSTINNFKHDLQSQFTAQELASLLQKEPSLASISNGKTYGNVTGSFVMPILNVFKLLMDELGKLKTNGSRIFITGHSLGGAYASLFAFIFALLKKADDPRLQGIESIHLVSFGAPTLLSDTARNSFNALLDEGILSFDRVVSQKVSSRTGVPIPGVTGTGNNIIPHIPAGFSHPGYRPLATDFQPEAKGRPYSLDMIRQFYGVSSKARGRDQQTWPFSTFEQEATGEVDSSLASVSTGLKTGNQDGGGPEKDKYSGATALRMPNFISVSGATKAAIFAHGEYMGMFFFGAFRLLGMKNPAQGNFVALFGLKDLVQKQTGVSGVMIQYVPFTPVGEVKQEEQPTSTGGRRKTQKNRRIRR